MNTSHYNFNLAACVHDGETARQVRSALDAIREMLQGHPHTHVVEVQERYWLDENDGSDGNAPPKNILERVFS